MRMTDFVFKIARELEDISRKPEQIINDKQHYIHLASRTIVFQLKKLLSHYSKSLAEADEISLQPFVDFLKKISQKYLIDTDASPLHNPKTHANQILRFFIKLLAEQTNDNPLQLQFSSLILGEKQYDGELDRVVMSDGNKTVIDIMECLETARRSADHKLRHTHPVKGLPEFLSPAEENRVINYSHKAARFYQDIQNDASEKAKNKSHNKLRKAMGAQVLSSYGEAGRGKLKDALYNDVDTRQQLIKTLSEFPNTEWGIYLDNFKPSELNKIVWTVSADNSLSRNDQKINAFLMQEWHRRYRSQIQDRQNLIDSLQLCPRKEWKNFLSLYQLEDLIQLAMKGPPILDLVKKRQANMIGSDPDSALAFLANELFNRLRNSIHDADNLFKAMQSYAREDWSAFLKKFKVAELNELLLGKNIYDKETFLKSVSEMKLESKNQSYEAAAHFVLLELYRNDLAARPNDYNTFWGWASGYASPKLVKEKVASLASILLTKGVGVHELKSTLLAVINSDEKLIELINSNKKIANMFNPKHVSTKNIKLTSSERKALEQAVDGGTFGTFMSHISQHNEQQLKSQHALGRH